MYRVGLHIHCKMIHGPYHVKLNDISAADDDDEDDDIDDDCYPLLTFKAGLYEVFIVRSR